MTEEEHDKLVRILTTPDGQGRIKKALALAALISAAYSEGIEDAEREAN